MKDLHDRLAAAQVHTLLAQFTDVHGVAKGKFVPLAHLDALLTDGVAFSGASIAGTGLPRTGPRAEYWARGYASTATPMPWLPGHARIVCDGWVADQPFEACPRQVLRRATARLAEQGWQLRVAISPEFFLLKREDERWLPADDGDRLPQPSYDLKSLPRQAGFLQALQQALQQCRLDVLQFDHQHGHSQFQLDIGADEALAAADHLMLFKLAAQALAEARGMVFSMMAKPFVQQPGSGMPMQLMLWKGHGDNATRLFVPHAPDGSALASGLSPLGQQFAAGVLAHAPALCALAAPTVNSYKRLQAGGSTPAESAAPTHVAHGSHNRSAMLRTLGASIECRLADASCNPYLVLAGLIAAGLDGIERRLPLPPGTDEDLLTLAPAALRERGIAPLPRQLDDALAALAADAVISHALGPVLIEQFQRLKQAEWADYQRQVSQWELQRYAAAF